MNRPHILVNVAMSADGKLDTVARKGISISSSADKARVDRLRASMDAVLVGGRTLIDEDPKLTVKSPALRAERIAKGLEENPVKVGIVSVADLRLDGFFLTAGRAWKLIYTTSRTTPGQVIRLEKAGAQVFVVGKQRVDLFPVMESLYQQDIRNLMVEGGGTIISEFFRLGLVDELTVYIAPHIFGGASAPTLADGPGFLQGQDPDLKLESLEKFDDEGGILVHYTIIQKGVNNGSNSHAH
jgi:2,5-diamino-6-(ribosylamino)-4(3H)-pyrimidinone 5'-phosphate reductase